MYLSYGHSLRIILLFYFFKAGYNRNYTEAHGNGQETDVKNLKYRQIRKDVTVCQYRKNFIR